MWVSRGYSHRRDDENSRYRYLLPVAPFFCHHLPQCLQHFDAQALLILLQQLLGVFDQSGQGETKSDESSSSACNSLQRLKELHILQDSAVTGLYAHMHCRWKLRTEKWLGLQRGKVSRSQQMFLRTQTPERQTNVSTNNCPRQRNP